SVKTTPGHPLMGRALAPAYASTDNPLTFCRATATPACDVAIRAAARRVMCFRPAGRRPSAAPRGHSLATSPFAPPRAASCAFDLQAVDLLPPPRQQSSAACPRAQVIAEILERQRHRPRARLHQQGAARWHHRHRDDLFGTALGLGNLDQLVALAAVEF